MSAETRGESIPAATPYRGRPRALPGTIPASATSFLINAVGFVGLIVAVVVLRILHHAGHRMANPDRMLILLGAAAIPIGLLDLLVLKVYRRASTGLDWDKDFTPSFARVATKLLGLAVTLSAIAFLYWVFPEYHGTFYDPFYNLLKRFAVPLGVFAALYFFLVDGLLSDPKDSYWQLGRWVLGGGQDARGKDLANHARGWVVKLFFLPLMVVYAHDSTRNVIEVNLNGAGFLTNLHLYDYLYEAIFFGDLAFCVIGYTLSLRVMDSHTRTAEPTMVGWAVALFCYQPFFSLFENNYVHYDDSGGWGDWIGKTAHLGFVGTTGMEWLRASWAIVVLVLVAIYVLATVTFGWRFSNLTHRGILTNGPYRFSKHPAYIAKNLSWWMTSVPFVLRAGYPGWLPWQSVRHCILLGVVNAMYFMRARTEEKHLSRDPVYVEYALWMNEHGMFAWLGRLVPFFRYVPPTNLPPITAKQEDQQRAELAAEATA